MKTLHSAPGGYLGLGLLSAIVVAGAPFALQSGSPAAAAEQAPPREIPGERLSREALGPGRIVDMLEGFAGEARMKRKAD